MIGNKPVILEPVNLRLALAQKRLRIVRPFPARGFLGDAFDIFQETHRADHSMLIFGVCCFQTLSRAAEFHFLRRAAAIGRLLVNLLSEDHSSTDNQGRLRLIIEGYGRRVGIASAAWIICFGAAKWITKTNALSMPVSRQRK